MPRLARNLLIALGLSAGLITLVFATRAECSEDAQCALTADRCCSGCCPAEVKATTVEKQEQTAEACRAVKCEAPSGCSGDCPKTPLNGYTAVCRLWKCVPQERE